MEENNKEDILTFDWKLDFGYLSEDVLSEYRSVLIYELYVGKDTDYEKDDLLYFGRSIENNYKKLIKYLEQKKTVRIWYSHSPDSLCGLYYLCSILKEYDNEVHIIKSPEYVNYYDNRYGFCAGWGMIKSNVISSYLNLDKVMHSNEIKEYAEYWQQLVIENSPLRAVVGCSPVSVNENFYDTFIYRYFPTTPIKEGHLIGIINGYVPIRVCTTWWARRIQKMINEGKVVVVKNHEKEMQRVIKRIPDNTKDDMRNCLWKGAQKNSKRIIRSE